MKKFLNLSNLSLSKNGEVVLPESEIVELSSELVSMVAGAEFYDTYDPPEAGGTNKTKCTGTNPSDCTNWDCADTMNGSRCTNMKC